MIPNHVPMAAVYLNPDATGARNNRLFSHPVVAWRSGAPMVVGRTGTLCPAYQVRDKIECIGLWQYGWRPSYDEMSTLLPKQEQEEILVTAQQLTDTTWSAFRTVNGVLLASAATLDELEDALERHHLYCTVEKVVPLGDINADDEV